MEARVKGRSQNEKKIKVNKINKIVRNGKVGGGRRRRENVRNKDGKRI